MFCPGKEPFAPDHVPAAISGTLPGTNTRLGVPWSGIAEVYLLAAMSIPKLRSWWLLDHVLSLNLLEAGDGDKEPLTPWVSAAAWALLPLQLHTAAPSAPKGGR